MIIALLQLNARLAQPEVNGRAIEAAYQEAVGRGAEMVVSPELAVPGYMPGDRLLEPTMRRRVEVESHRLKAIAGSVPLVFGTCSPSDSGKLWNELWWCEMGNLRSVTRKSHVEHNEGRYFEPCPTPQEPVAHLDKKVAFAIGENTHGYCESLVRAGATLIVNVVASTCALGSFVPNGRSPSWALPSKSAQRHGFLSNLSKTCNIPVAYVNRVGAEGSHIFDGGSCLALPDGTFQCFDDFGDGVFIADTGRQGDVWSSKDGKPNEGAWLRRALALGLKDNLSKQCIEAAVVGLSGGIDSAVVAALAAETLGPQKVLGVALPTRYTSAESTGLAKAQASKLGIHYLEINADAPFAGAAESMARALPGRYFGLTDENLQCRCRGMLLMGLTTEPAVHRMFDTSGCAVLNTGNKSEAATGYFTLYGDAIGVFGILGDLLKARVYALARELGSAVPTEVVNRPPTAELRPNQTDESSLLPYRLLDAILGALIEAGRLMEGLHDDLADILEGQHLLEAREALPRVQRLICGTEFKRRQAPFALKVTHRAFGIDTNVPLTSI